MVDVELHEELRRRDVLAAPVDGDIVVFISHTWLGLSHPDPRGEQLVALQRILRRLLSGKHSIPNAWFECMLYGQRRLGAEAMQRQFTEALLWMDYWCVPQVVEEPAAAEERAAAIRSIPVYVARSDYFLVLAPRCEHVDLKETWGLREWRKRAWCRFELCAVYLIHGSGDNILIAEAESQVRLDLCSSWLHNPPGEGELSCCRLGHQLNKDAGGARRPCDGAALGEALEAMYSERLQTAAAAGDLETYRLLVALESYVFAGLPGHPSRSTSTDANPLRAFLRKYRFDGAFNEQGRRGSGWSPLRLAAYEGNARVVRALLDAKAAVECALAAPRVDVGHTAGMSVLAGAVQMYGNLEVIHLLLSAGASLSRLSPRLATQPADRCCSTALLEVLLKRGHPLHRLTNKLGADPLHLALYHQQLGAPAEELEQLVSFLLARGVPPRSRTKLGFSHLHVAAQSGDVSLVRTLLADPEEADAGRIPAKPGWRARLAAQLRGPGDQSNPRHALGAEWWGSTALHVAAADGDPSIVEALLEHGFAINALNQRGRTPVHLACLYGHEQALQCLARCASFGETATIRCRHDGKTARDLAVSSGYEDLLGIFLGHVDDSARSSAGHHDRPFGQLVAVPAVDVVPLDGADLARLQMQLPEAEEELPMALPGGLATNRCKEEERKEAAIGNIN